VGVVDDHRRCGLLPPTAIPRRRALRRSGGRSVVRRRPERHDDARPRTAVESRRRPPRSPEQGRAADASHLPRPFSVGAGSGRLQGDHGLAAAGLGWANSSRALAPLPPHRWMPLCPKLCMRITEQGMVGLRLGARHVLYGNGQMASGISPLTRKADNSKGRDKKKKRERQAK
jgi:hypothetical protein